MPKKQVEPDKTWKEILRCLSAQEQQMKDLNTALELILKIIMKKGI